VNRARSLAVLRVVLDTHVILSALVCGGSVTALMRQAWQAGRLHPLASTVTAQELIRVLAYPKLELTADDPRELLVDYLPFTEVVTIPKPPPRVPDGRDPHDLPFLHLAAAGRADLLVKGNADLLALASAGARPRLRFRILTVPAQLDQLRTPPFSDPFGLSVGAQPLRAEPRHRRSPCGRSQRRAARGDRRRSRAEATLTARPSPAGSCGCVRRNRRACAAPSPGNAPCPGARAAPRRAGSCAPARSR
jgi:uncharacterized protein